MASNDVVREMTWGAPGLDTGNVQPPTPEEALELLTDILSKAGGAGDDRPDYAMRTLATELESEVFMRCSRRRRAEDQWYEDALQYAGIYDAATQAELESREDSSRIYTNITRSRTRTLRARLRNILLPSDLPNWNIRPTPVPSLSPSDERDVVTEAVRQAQAARDQAQAAQADAQGGALPATEAGPPPPAPDQAGAPPPVEGELMPPPGEAAPEGGSPAPPGAPPGGGAPQTAEPVQPRLSAPFGSVAPVVSEDPGRLQDQVLSLVRNFLGLEKLDQMLFDRAMQRCDAMRRLMKDQLDGCNYAGVISQCIHVACKYGHGVVKGPVSSWRPKLSWRPAGDGWAMDRSVDRSMPIFVNVANWDFFPDPNHARIGDGQSTFELHRVDKQGLRMKATGIGFQLDATRRLLRSSPSLTAVYQTFLRSVEAFERGDTSFGLDDVFLLWEWRGAVEPDRLQKIVQWMDMDGDDGSQRGQALAKSLGVLMEDGTVDPFVAPEVVIYFCQGEILSVAPSPLQSGETVYSVFTLDPEETSIYGDGVPAMLNHAQRLLNASMRLLVENAAVSGIPVIYIDPRIRERGAPAGAPIKLRSGLVLTSDRLGVAEAKDLIFTVQIDGNTADLIKMVELSLKFFDDESMLPQIAQGDQGAHVTQTAHGMTLLSNAVNISFQDMASTFDADVTLPNLRRLYHWNMQFSDRDDVKGDMEIVPQGASVLLVREVQAGQRMMLVNMLRDHMGLKAALHEYNVYKRFIEAQQLPVEETMVTEPEWRRAKSRAEQIEMLQAQAAAAGDQTKVEVAQITGQITKEVEAGRAEVERERIASTREIAREKAQVEQAKTEKEAASKERIAHLETLLKKHPERYPGEGI